MNEFKKKLTITVLAARREDMDAVKAVDERVVGYGNGDVRIRHPPGKCTAVCRVASLHDGRVIGFSVASVGKGDELSRLLRVAVDEEYRRLGVGRSLVYALTSLLRVRTPRLAAAVNERDRDAIMFFKSIGFKAVSPVSRNHFGDDDGLVFVYQD